MMGTVVQRNLEWMTPNLVLAAAPFLMAVYLFAWRRPRTMAWWAGVVVFVAFLPNAPYVVSDLIHLSGQLRRSTTDLQASALLLEYGLLIGAGLALYGGCLFLLRRRLELEGRGQWRWPAEFALHVLSSIGIFLGRAMRLNSWDIVLSPGSVLRYVGVPRATTIVIIVFTFCVLVAATLAMRVPLAIHDQRRSGR
ncbi:MAG TPA: DUF1361 domain-containing protein [Acidimicrobiales bacterium]|jgi:uncharacterized membrane protein|nr:DUF1361 domain-containing protein [Acidimicrobiales bacterium]